MFYKGRAHLLEVLAVMACGVIVIVKLWPAVFCVILQLHLRVSTESDPLGAMVACVPMSVVTTLALGACTQFNGGRRLPDQTSLEG